MFSGKKSLKSITQLSYEEIEYIFENAKLFKNFGIPKKYKGDWVLMFLEPSTRTRLSFERALRLLGFETYLFNWDSSSMVKGENLKDTVLTLKAQGFEGIILRTPINKHYVEIEDIDIKFINAGDGTNEHPSQALIDAFTLMEKFNGKIKNLKIVFVGDTKYSRVFRSDSWLFKFLGAEVGICSPKSLMPSNTELLPVDKIFHSIEEALKWCDIAIFLRIQKERQGKKLIPSEKEYLETFGLTKERAKYLLKTGKFFMHPGPVNRNVEIHEEVIYMENSLILHQVANGIYVRASIIDFLYKEIT